MLLWTVSVYFLWAVGCLCFGASTSGLMAYLAAFMFSWYIPWAHPKCRYRYILSIVLLLGPLAISHAFYGSSYGFYHHNMACCRLFTAYYGVRGDP